MGTGKTVVGKILSEKLNREFVEMDEVIVQKEGREIGDIFAKDGEAHFRSLEKNLLENLSQKQDLVVSCGGGLVCNDGNLKVLCASGFVVALCAEPLTIHERTKKDAHRPLLNIDNPLKRIEELLSIRERYYAQAHYSIDTENLMPEEVADKIMTRIEADKRWTKL